MFGKLILVLASIIILSFLGQRDSVMCYFLTTVGVVSHLFKEIGMERRNVEVRVILRSMVSLFWCQEPVWDP
jgi:hypothetical protein